MEGKTADTAGNGTLENSLCHLRQVFQGHITRRCQNYPEFRFEYLHIQPSMNAAGALRGSLTQEMSYAVRMLAWPLVAPALGVEELVKTTTLRLCLRVQDAKLVFMRSVTRTRWSSDLVEQPEGRTARRPGTRGGMR